MSWRNTWLHSTETSFLIFIACLILCSLGKDYWAKGSIWLMAPLAITLLLSIAGVLISIVGMIWTS